jgi:hypothetical protein
MNWRHELAEGFITEETWEMKDFLGKPVEELFSFTSEGGGRKYGFVLVASTLRDQHAVGILMEVNGTPLHTLSKPAIEISPYGDKLRIILHRVAS